MDNEKPSNTGGFQCPNQGRYFIWIGSPTFLYPPKGQIYDDEYDIVKPKTGCQLFAEHSRCVKKY